MDILVCIRDVKQFVIFFLHFIKFFIVSTKFVFFTILYNDLKQHFLTKIHFFLSDNSTFFSLFLKFLSFHQHFFFLLFLHNAVKHYFLPKIYIIFCQFVILFLFCQNFYCFINVFFSNTRFSKISEDIIYFYISSKFKIY